MTTKRDIIGGAFDELGLSSYDFDIQPEQWQAALKRLDALVLSWQTRGIRLGYNAGQNLDADTGLPDYAIQAAVTNLARRIAPLFGRQVAPETILASMHGMDQLLVQAAQPIPMQLPETMPAGAGNKPWRWRDPYILPSQDTIDTGPDNALEY